MTLFDRAVTEKDFLLLEDGALDVTLESKQPALA